MVAQLESGDSGSSGLRTHECAGPRVSARGQVTSRFSDPSSVVPLIAVFAILAPGPLRGASVYVEDRTDCLDQTGLEEAITDVLLEYEAGKKGSTTVVGNPGETTAMVALRVVTMAGEIILERRFEFKPEDCPSSTDLITTVLGRFLQDFPREEWGEDPPEPAPVSAPERVVVTQDVSEFSGLVLVGGDTRWLPTSGDLELGVAIDVGSQRHRLAASAMIRVGVPHALGGGHFIETIGMLGVGWRYAGQSWLTRLEVRTGGLLVSGFGYASNHHTWLLWLEFQGAVMWHWNWVLIGPQIGLSPLRHKAITADGDSANIPWIRAGVVLAIPFWSKRM